MMPKDCSGKAPGMVCVGCEQRDATAVICGWPVCGESVCRYLVWIRKDDGPVKIEAGSTTDKGCD